MFCWKGWLNLLKSFVAQSFLWFFMVCDKNCPFLIFYEKITNAFMHYLSDKKLLKNVPGRLSVIIVSRGHKLT